MRDELQGVGGIATICGKQFAFPVDSGCGLILLDGHWTLVKFSCPLESLPPRGKGHVLSQSFPLRVEAGEFFLSDDSPIHFGREIAS